MKTCPLCGTTYATRVEFCFRDGTPLADGAVRPAVATAPAEAADPDALAPPSPLDPPAPVIRPPPSPGREVPQPKGGLKGGGSWKDVRPSLSQGDTLVPSEEDEEPPVREDDGPERETPARSADEAAAAAPPRVAPGGRSGGTNWVIILAALAILGIGGAWLFTQSSGPEAPENTVAAQVPVEPPPVVPPPPAEPPPSPPEPVPPAPDEVVAPVVAPTPSTMGAAAATPTPTEGQRPAGTEGRSAPTGVEDTTARSKAPTEKRDATAPTEGGTASQWSGGTAPEAAATTGKLTITSSPAGATVRLNGKAQPGVTPLDLSLAYGAYEVEVELAGHKMRSRKVDLASAAVSVPIELQPLVVEGTVMIFGPVGAKAFVDEKEVPGNLPGKMTLSEGKHTFRLVTADGVSSEEVHTVRFDPSGAQFSVTLQRK